MLTTMPTRMPAYEAMIAKIARVVLGGRRKAGGRGASVLDMATLLELERNAVVQEWTVAQPAAGADWQLIVPANTWYRVESGFFLLTTSAQAATRFIKLQIIDLAANIVWEGDLVGAGVAASLSYRAGMARLGAQSTSAGTGGVPNILFLPDVWLPPGYTLQTATLSIQTLDQYNAVRGLVSVASGAAT